MTDSAICRDAYAVTREHKLALIVGFSLVLVLGVLISDHFSKARKQDMAEDIQPTSARLAGASVPGVRMQEEAPTGGLMPLPGVGAGFVSASGVGVPSGAGQPGGVGQVVQGVPGGTAPGTGPDVRPVPQNEIVMGRQTVGAGDGPSGTGGMVRRPDSAALAQVDEQIPSAVLPSQTQPPVVPGGMGAAPAPVAPPVVIPMQRHEVKEGDTLYRIAVRYYGEGKLWEKVREFNKGRVNGDDLRVGVTLQLPPKDVLLGKPYVPPVGGVESAAPGRPESRSEAAAGGRAQPRAAGSFREYVVKDGDTLSTVARKTLGSSKRWPELLEANKGTLSDPESLKVGMKLRVPTGVTASASR